MLNTNTVLYTLRSKVTGKVKNCEQMDTQADGQIDLKTDDT